MFKNERIGFKDEKGYNICEGDTVRFKWVCCPSNFCQGVVVYHTGICAFVIDRGIGDYFMFNQNIFDLEIIVVNKEPTKLGQSYKEEKD